MRIDLNADIGEGYGAYKIGNDEGLLSLVTSANVACGFHAGDAVIMQRLAALAEEKGVALGAHPGFDDLWGFGRRSITMNASHLEYFVAYQIGALQALAAYSGAPVRHVKAHGALYNMASTDEAYAGAIAKAVKTVDPSLILVGMPGSEMQRTAEREGLAFAREGFCDRLYLPGGSLTSRSTAGSVILDPAKAANQALRIALDKEAVTASGECIQLEVDTICIHGDEPGSCEVARAVRAALEGAGVLIASFTSA